MRERELNYACSNVAPRHREALGRCDMCDGVTPFSADAKKLVLSLDGSVANFVVYWRRLLMFKGRRFEQSTIFACVRWYLSYRRSQRDLKK